VDKKDLVVANALISLTWSTVTVIGSSLGGFTIAGLGIVACFIIDGLTYLCSLLFIFLLYRYADKHGIQEKQFQETSILKDNSDEEEINKEENEKDINLCTALWKGLLMFKDGLVYLKNDRYLLVISLIKGFCSMVWGPIDLVNVRLAEDEFPINGSGATTLGILWSILGLGGGIGPILCQQFGGNKSLKSAHIVFLVSFILRVGSYFLQSWSPNFYVWILGNLTRTAGESIAWVWTGSILQMTTPSKFIGRVLAFDLAFCTFGKSLVVYY
jgi:hypothetical protein